MGDKSLKIVSFRPHFSRNTLLLMLAVGSVLVAGLYWQKDLLQTVYFKDQLTTFGLAINGTILAIFTIGLLRMVQIFFSYSAEEAAVRRFILNQEQELENPLHKVTNNRIISRRYHAMAHLHAANTPISQGALASTLLANESTRTSLPKFISNVLILTGVFGTIVSLSIALLGASDLLENSVNVGGMGLVIHGMSTALSTTITAIICYLFFSYFFLKLTDAQTNLISAVEQVTTAYLAPKFQVDKETTLYEFTGLVRSLQELVKQMHASQQISGETEQRIEKMIDQQQERLNQANNQMEVITALLRRGFRLQDEQ